MRKLGPVIMADNKKYEATDIQKQQKYDYVYVKVTLSYWKKMGPNS